MFRALLLASVAATAAAPALAADLPTRKEAPAPVYAPIFTWTGFYLGLNAGVGWADGNSVTVYDPTINAYVGLSGGSKSGFVGGAQAGYNYQMGSIVLGVETDIQYADLGGRVSWGNYGWFGIGSSNGQYVGTVRARVGYAIDRTLLYVTGGFAYGGLNSGWWGGNHSASGWTLGGGVEYAFTNNWTARLEGLYVNFDKGNRTLSFTRPLVPGTYVVSGGSGNGGGIVRAAINYKF